MANLDKFIGKGITFPLEIGPNGGIYPIGGLPLLRSSIFTILSWPYNQRFFLQEFGSKLFTQLEEPADDSTNQAIRAFVIDAINKWEKRVEIISTTITSIKDGFVNVKITYRLRNTDFADSFIFPFYQNIKY